ncbi:hypothetical protein CFP65_3281 [Kitasatospora sp. MMS16-BH015]|uniref:hypothetical protein n=1 Tax=Kitasatospora sp. MMS16-BH015 TaxID=2018025 RepID=UPI000CA29229|nr:hypothetical protein [Kitasatospora sp. MMS16-BH015]AUG78082.1 hypothetical protein CFP65_3281 [Kitasatospora sp. MMS16-BH015]
MYQPADIHRAADQLRTVRTEWAALLIAVETPPAAAWPPAQLSTHLAQQQAAEADLLVADRAPLTLRQHPAPANLTALDAAVRVEGLLFDLADTLAAAAQRPIGRRLVSSVGRPEVWADDEADAADPRRWRFRSPTDPGSRRHGLHFAALWVEGRLLDEDTEPERHLDGSEAPALFARLPEHLRHETIRVARQCERLVLRVLELDERETPVEGRPCPWCGGALTLHTAADQAPRVTCDGGSGCSAAVPLDNRGRRVWGAVDLLTLIEALNEAVAVRAA